MKLRILRIALLHSLVITALIKTSVVADGFELLGSIPSQHNLYYTTMAPQGNFIAMGDQRQPGAGIDIINVVDPEFMFEVGHVYTGHMTYQLAWSGNYIYSPASWDGIFIYDASDFNNIFLVSETSFGEPLTTVAIRDDIALVGGTSHMYSINIVNPFNPHVVWSTDNFGCSDMALGDSIAYIYLIYEYVVIMDISLPENPHEITSFAYPGVTGIEIDRSERYLYLTAGFEGLVIYDIEDPSTPTFVSSTPMPNRAWCIDVCSGIKYQKIVFISGYTGGLWAVDVSNPMNPIPLDNHNSSLWSCYVISERDIVFNTIADSMLSLRFERTTGFQNNYSCSATERFSMGQNYPNPFNARTAIRFVLPEDSNVRVALYDILGRKLETLFEGAKPGGAYTISWDASTYPSGVYFARLETNNATKSIRMLLLK